MTWTLVRQKAVYTFSGEHQRAGDAQDGKHASDKAVDGHGYRWIQSTCEPLPGERQSDTEAIGSGQISAEDIHR